MLKLAVCCTFLVLGYIGYTDARDTSCIEKRKGYIGNELERKYDVKSAADCQVSCWYNSQCSFWTYHSPSKMCRLQYLAGERNNGQYLTSGPKVCPGDVCKAKCSSLDMKCWNTECTFAPCGKEKSGVVRYCDTRTSYCPVTKDRCVDKMAKGRMCVAGMDWQCYGDQTCQTVICSANRCYPKNKPKPNPFWLRCSTCWITGGYSCSTI